jgi:hypothetical protein
VLPSTGLISFEFCAAGEPKPKRNIRYSFSVITFTTFPVNICNCQFKALMCNNHRNEVQKNKICGFMQNKLHSEKVEQQDWWIYRKQSKI